MRFDKSILSIILLIAALVYSSWFVFAGFGNAMDPLYWLYRFQTLSSGWMAVGTILTGGAWVRLFGAELLPLRILGWLCVVAAIMLPYWCLLTREQRRDNKHWLAVTFMLMSYGAFQEFSPGTLSVLLLSAIWVTAVQAERGNRAFDILTAVLVGLAVSVRFPNILVLLILIPFWKKRCLWNLPIAALSAGLVYLLGWWLITPAGADAAMNSHQWGKMLGELWDKGGLLLGSGLLCLGLFALAEPLRRCMPARWSRWSGYVAGVLAGGLMVYYVAMVPKPTQWYNIDLTYLISAFCLVIAASSLKQSDSSHPSPFILGMAILIVATLGTDTAWLKLFPAVLCLLPVAAVQLAPSRRKYLWPLTFLFALAVTVRFTTNSIGQCDLSEAQTMTAVSPYKCIAVREVENRWLEQIVADHDSLSSLDSAPSAPPILAVGQRMHQMRAVTGCQAAAYNEFWSNIFDSVYTAKYRSVIREQRPIVFCSFTPQFKTKPTYRDRESAFEQMLREEGYHELDRSKYRYMIYIPQP